MFRKIKYWLLAKSGEIKLLGARVQCWIQIKRGTRLCSGWGVYPDGLDCPGCSDCAGDEKVQEWFI